MQNLIRLFDNHHKSNNKQAMSGISQDKIRRGIRNGIFYQ
ncbi:hypothetical protein BN1221_04343 [Brenneria goodwinii]|uniref:Uncharacterized protein n=1 Tax=Brenneria goodwinii TaxID=1109412 RepID=A0A0G4K0X9_9GAMM|nr:hypothetical protein BN1221_04343 [Brenneria goodwinii]